LADDLPGFLPIKKVTIKIHLQAQQENLGFLDDQTGLFSSPVTVTVLSTFGQSLLSPNCTFGFCLVGWLAK